MQIIKLGYLVNQSKSVIIVIQELKSGYEEEGRHTGRPPLLVTAAVAASKSTIDSAYDIPGISRYTVNTGYFCRTNHFRNNRFC